LKSGIYGKNVSFKADKKVTSILENSLKDTLIDYIEHTDGNPRLTKVSI